MSAITALTAQNTTGVQGILEVTPDFLALRSWTACFPTSGPTP
jgi:hydroxymethylpyrimidine/phosphomethylpyrimidine kinase